jgi:hypothetical protein
MVTDENDYIIASSNTLKYQESIFTCSPDDYIGEEDFYSLRIVEINLNNRQYKKRDNSWIIF